MNTTRKPPVYFFLFFFLIYCFKSFIFSLTIDTDTIIYVKGFLNLLIIILCLFTIFYCPFKVKCLIAVTAGLLVFNTVLFDNKAHYEFLVAISICVLSKEIPWRDLIKYILVIHLIVIVMAAPFLFFCDYFFIMDDRFGPRFTGGFDNPNTIGQYLIMLLSVLSLWISEYCRGRKLQVLIFLFIFLYIILCLYLTYSRTSLILAIAMGGAFIFTRMLNYSKRTSKYFFIFPVLLIIIVTFQFYGIINFGSNWYLSLANEIFTSRLWFGNLLYNALGLPGIFNGQNIDNYLPIDFYFIRMCYSVGILYFVAMCLVFLYALKRSRVDIYMWIVLFLMLIDTLTETYFSVPFYSISMFIIFNKTNISDFSKG